MFLFFFFNDTATTEIYTLSLHDALPIARDSRPAPARGYHRGGDQHPLPDGQLVARRWGARPDPHHAAHSRPGPEGDPAGQGPDPERHPADLRDRAAEPDREPMAKRGARQGAGADDAALSRTAAHRPREIGRAHV